MMIERQDVPDCSMLQPFVAEGHFADCYRTTVAKPIPLESFIRAFYSTRIFSVERWMLKVFARRPSTLVDVDALARGASRQFAAWDVENRTENELLLRDMTGRTRSWLMSECDQQSGSSRLYFGSAVLGSTANKTSRPVLSPLIRASLPMHHWYSKALFRAARTALDSGD